MHRRVLLIAFLLAPLANPADFPSAESLIDKFIGNSGGAAAYARTKSATMTGTVEIEGRNIKGIISIVDASQKSWTAMDLPGIGRIEQGYDGNTAWESSALQGPRILEGDEKNAIRRGSTFAFVSNWRQEYKSYVTTGEEDVNGKPAWKVDLTPDQGAKEVYYFDKASGLLVQMTATVISPLGEIPTSVTISDYRPVEGIQTAFTMRQSAMGQVIVMRFDKVTYNATVPKDRFDPPAAVKALLKK
jgi:hypothetical protein